MSVALRLTIAVLAAMGSASSSSAAAAAAQTPNFPSPTTNNLPTGGLQLGFPPQLTPSPTLPKGDLKRRQNAQTCAFLSGNPAAPLYCSPGLQCTANTHLHQAGCCPQNQACAVATACVPYMSLAFCDSSCYSDPVMIKCLHPIYPDCVTITMHVGSAGGTAMYYDCGVAGLGGAYAAQWAPTQGAVQPATQGATATPPVGGANNNQGIGGNGANVNGNGNTVIYNSGGAGQVHALLTASRTVLARGGTLAAVVVAALLW